MRESSTSQSRLPNNSPFLACFMVYPTVLIQAQHFLRQIREATTDVLTVNRYSEHNLTRQGILPAKCVCFAEFTLRFPFHFQSLIACEVVQGCSLMKHVSMVVRGIGAFSGRYCHQLLSDPFFNYYYLDKSLTALFSKALESTKVRHNQCLSHSSIPEPLQRVCKEKAPKRLDKLSHCMVVFVTSK